MVRMSTLLDHLTIQALFYHFQTKMRLVEFFTKSPYQFPEPMIAIFRGDAIANLCNPLTKWLKLIIP